jgi:hypothetical protein
MANTTSAVMMDPSDLSATQRVKQEWNSFRGTMGKFHGGLASNKYGRAALSGAASSLGWDYTYDKKAGSMVNKGFLGYKNTGVGKYYSALRSGGASRLSALGRTGAQAGRSFSHMASGGKMGGAITRRFGSQLLGVAGKALGPAMGLLAVAEGARTGGVSGAFSAGVESVGSWAAMEVGLAALSGTVNPLALGALAGYAGYKFADASRDYGRSLKKLNMGAPIVDMFGTVATTRQRSLQALQNTHINGRMALGNEGMLMHTNVYSRR